MYRRFSICLWQIYKTFENLENSVNYQQYSLVKFAYKKLLLEAKVDIFEFVKVSRIIWAEKWKWLQRQEPLIRRFLHVQNVLADIHLKNYLRVNNFVKYALLLNINDIN